MRELSRAYFSFAGAGGDVCRQRQKHSPHAAQRRPDGDGQQHRRSAHYARRNAVIVDLLHEQKHPQRQKRAPLSSGASENARQRERAATYAGSARNIPHTPPSADPMETASSTTAGLAPAAALITRGEMP